MPASLGGDDEPSRKRLEFHGVEKIGRRGAGNNTSTNRLAAFDREPEFEIRQFDVGLSFPIETPNRLAQQALYSAKSGAEEKSATVLNKDVFIVHGHDELAKTQVARFLERGLNPIILHEQKNAGCTIIEKFEHHGTVAGFAVVLLTRDDVGGPNERELQPRTRQNVIGEMFWFAGTAIRIRRRHLHRVDDRGA
jgi:hypothetical protein